jgi:hypothetical protein
MTSVRTLESRFSAEMAAVDVNFTRGSAYSVRCPCRLRLWAVVVVQPAGLSIGFEKLDADDAPQGNAETQPDSVLRIRARPRTSPIT